MCIGLHGNDAEALDTLFDCNPCALWHSQNTCIKHVDHLINAF